ncbi:hypothetical protein DV714_03405 [Parageobacillus thermoglucosidasius]|nr:hypothetical protein DV714_03405 [Parageobacillus thermoglucosidasius]
MSLISSHEMDGKAFKQSFVFIVAVNEKFVNETVFAEEGARAGNFAALVELQGRISRQDGGERSVPLL